MIKSVHAKTIGYKEDEKTYTFASYPRAFVERYQTTGKAKFRNQAKLEENFCKYDNVMFDRRILRGSTVPRHVVSVGVPTGPYDEKNQLAVRRRVASRRPVKGPVKRLFSPPPVRGRRNVPVQTETFLEELAAAIEVYDEQIQTDIFLDRPSSPAFIRTKAGVDVQTQIYDGELFKFNIEVAPLVQVIVGKTIEQALLETVQEEEMSSLKEQHHRYEQLRYAQMVEQQRLEEQERRLSEEKQNRVRQHEIAMRNQEETTEKVAAAAFSQSYLIDLASTVFQNLMDKNYFFETIAKDNQGYSCITSSERSNLAIEKTRKKFPEKMEKYNIEQWFMPWLMNRVLEKLASHILECTILDDIVSHLLISGEKKFMPIKPILPEIKASGSDMEITPEVESEEEEETFGYEDEELIYAEEEGEYEIEEAAAEEELVKKS